MASYINEWAWTCAGCGSKTKLSLNLSEHELKQAFNPAKYIANEKFKLERGAANLHVGVCKRPL